MRVPPALSPEASKPARQPARFRLRAVRAGLVAAILLIATIFARADDSPSPEPCPRSSDSQRREWRDLFMLEKMARCEAFHPEILDATRLLLAEKRNRIELFARYGLLSPDELASKTREIHEIAEQELLDSLSEIQKRYWGTWNSQVPPNRVIRRSKNQR